MSNIKPDTVFHLHIFPSKYIVFLMHASALTLSVQLSY